MWAQSEGREAFPFLVFWILEVFEPNASKVGDGTPFAEAVDSQRVTCYVHDEGVAKDGLSEHLCLGGRVNFNQAHFDI
jgi:hypothetical protein